MGEKDIIGITVEELRRVSLINQAIEKVMTLEEAAERIGLSYRQTKRMVARVRQEGDTGIIHRLRGNPGSRAVDDKVRAKTIELYDERYRDFGPTLASEKLYELDKIKVHHDILRRWLIDTDKDKWNWQRQARPHRQWRQRKDCFGEMVRGRWFTS